MIYQANLSRLDALEKGSPSPTGGDYCGGDCFIFGALQALVGCGWIMAVSDFLSSSTSLPSTLLAVTSFTVYRSENVLRFVVVTKSKEEVVEIVWQPFVVSLAHSPRSRERSLVRRRVFPDSRKLER